MAQLKTKRPNPRTKQAKAPAQPLPAQPFLGSAELQSVLAAVGRRIEVAVGTVLFERGTPTQGLFLVLKGKFAVWSGEDHARITRVAGAGSLLGLPATVRRKEYSLSAEAVTDAEVCVVSPESLSEIMASNFRIGMEVITMLADEVSALRKLAVYTT